MVKRITVGLATVVLIGIIGLVVFGRNVVDYKNADELVYALDHDEDVVGKTVKVRANGIYYTGLVYHFKPREDLQFISASDYKFKDGEEVVVEIKHVTPTYGGYIVGYK